MVIKTDRCSFSEYHVYPGHGIRMIRRDGALIVLGSSKVKSLLAQRKKPAKLTWTQAWRKLNKKIKVDEVSRRRTRKSMRVMRPIVGASVTELNARKQTAPKKSTGAQG
eukprot:876115_1